MNNLNYFPNDYLKELREKEGITQEKLANKIGISLRTYIRKENGETEFTVGQGEIIAQILHEDIFALFPINKGERGK